MCAKYLDGQFLNSQNLRKASVLRESAQSSTDSEKQLKTEQKESDLNQILAKEHQVTRSKAEARNVKEIARRREELKKKLAQISSELEMRRAKTDESLEFCRAQISRLEEFSGDVSIDNLSEVRRFIREVDLELLKRERDLDDSAMTKADLHAPATPLIDLPFMDLVKIGFGLSLPMIVAFLAGAAFIGTVLFNLFRL